MLAIISPWRSEDATECFAPTFAIASPSGKSHLTGPISTF
ncbi:hypothetical protein RDI58_010164 [Solanum bulbocastanum]|uniref:Uncharacterized protein n=1 Tax=Solanum bulbocastanum TaxID=147425 RepID=A0AAN8YJ71_SOLBU